MGTPTILGAGGGSGGRASGGTSTPLPEGGAATQTAAAALGRRDGGSIIQDDGGGSDHDADDESTQFGGSAAWNDTASSASDNDGDQSRRCDSTESGSIGSAEGYTSSSCSRAARLSRPGSREGRRAREPRQGPTTIRRPRPTGGGGTRTGDSLVSSRGDASVTSGTGGGRGSDAATSSDDSSEPTTSVSDGDDGDDNSDDDPLEPIPGEVKLVPSMFPDRSPTVFFEYPKELGMARFDNVYFSEPLGGRRLLFKTHWERNSVKNAFYRAGFSRTRSTLSWTASWGKHPTREGFRNLNRFQKVNHFPGSWCIGRKDRLMRTLARHKREINSAAAAAAVAATAAAAMPSVSKGGGGAGGAGGLGGGTGSSAIPPDITPDGFVLPVDRRAWLKAVDTEPKAIWIVKPPASSCGRGIRVINKASSVKVSKSKKCLVQRYIHNPMLIDGRKFDLRLYVLVTSMEPLRVYMFEEGLVRLSTKRYSLKNLRSRFTHLTNYSINKKSGSFKAPDDSDGQEATESTSASKWALTFFWKYLERTIGKKKSDEVQRTIEDVVLRTMVAADGDMTTHSHQFTRHRGCCYELFGFDVLLDDHLKPWLLEVNISPSLFGSSALDRRIKGTLMADIFHLVGFRPFDRTALRREERREAKHIPGTRRAVRAVAGRPQDAWRRCQTPASIKLSELGEDEWEVIRDTEDEQHRAGHFRILYPTAESVARLWPTFRSPRFLNGVLARWVVTGGLSNPNNRTDIGLTAERLATLSKFHNAGGENSNGHGAAGTTARSKGRAVGLRGSCAGDGRWEETTSNATTILSAGGRNQSLELGGRTGSSPRPASSVTSRASRSRARPLWRASATAASTVARVSAGPQPFDGRAGGGANVGKKAGKFLGPSIGGAGDTAGKGGAGGGERLAEVPRLQLRRVQSRVVPGTSLLTLRTPVTYSATKAGSSGSGSGSVGGRRISACEDRSTAGAVPRTRRASSASSSRPSTGRSSARHSSREGAVAVKGTPVGIGRRVADGRRSFSGAVKARELLRKRPQPLFLQNPERERVVLGRDDSSLPLHMNVGPHVSSAAVFSPLDSEVLEKTTCLPRPPCRAAPRSVGGTEGDTDPLPAFAAALLPSRCLRRAPDAGMAASHALSDSSFRARVTKESPGQSSSATSTTNCSHSSAATLGLLVDSRALRGPEPTPARGASGNGRASVGRGHRRIEGRSEESDSHIPGKSLGPKNDTQQPSPGSAFAAIAHRLQREGEKAAVLT